MASASSECLTVDFMALPAFIFPLWSERVEVTSESTDSSSEVSVLSCPSTPMKNYCGSSSKKAKFSKILFVRFS